jgi:hypothetical protein
MTQKTRAAITSEISSLLADNGTGAITAADLRTVVQDINDSADNTLTDNTLIVGLVAGSGAGSVTIYPATTANGYLAITPINNTGNYVSTLSNSNIGQSTTYSLPDPGASTTTILCTSGAQTVTGQKTFVAPILGAATATTLGTGTITISNGAAIATDSTTGHTALIQAYSTTGTAFETLGTLTNGAVANLKLYSSSPNGTVTLLDVINQNVVTCTTLNTHTSSTALSNVIGLSIPLSVGTYRISGRLIGTAAAAGGLTAELIASGGLVLTSANIVGENWNGTTPNARTTITALATDFSNSAAAYTDCYFDGSLIVSTAGTLNVQAAQHTSNSTATTVTVGSWLEAIRTS